MVVLLILVTEWIPYTVYIIHTTLWSKPTEEMIKSYTNKYSQYIPNMASWVIFFCKSWRLDLFSIIYKKSKFRYVSWIWILLNNWNWRPQFDMFSFIQYNCIVYLFVLFIINVFNLTTTLLLLFVKQKTNNKTTSFFKTDFSLKMHKIQYQI